MSAEPAPALRCAICGEHGTSEFLQDCFRCGRSYHLNPYNNQPGKDCGDALIGPSLGVSYLCDICLEEINEAVVAAESDAAPGGPTVPAAPVPPPAPSRTPRRRYRRREPS